MTQTLAYVYEIYIRTTPEKLWQALTDGEFTRQYFFGCTVESEWRPGAALVYAMEDGFILFDATIEAIEPYKRLVHSFRPNAENDDAFSADPPSRVTYEIERLGETCLLRLTHEHFAGESQTASRTNRGWQMILSGLKTFLETGEPLSIVRPEEAAAR